MFEEIRILRGDKKLYGRLVRLSWRLIEYKFFYYYPELVRSSSREKLDIPDSKYDKLEDIYLSLCNKLAKPNTVVHRNHHKYPLVDSSRAMQELDFSRHSVRLVISKHGTKKARESYPMF